MDSYKKARTLARGRVVATKSSTLKNMALLSLRGITTPLHGAISNVT
jgi:hypothetical protein